MSIDEMLAVLILMWIIHIALMIVILVKLNSHGEGIWTKKILMSIEKRFKERK